MDSYASLNGIKFIGENAHKELIDFVCEDFFNIQDRDFLQRLRHFRNQISYEGFNVSVDFLKRNMERIEGYIMILIENVERDL